MTTRSILGLLYMLQALQKLGEDVEPVLERHGLSLDRLDPAARIDRALELRIHTELGERLRNPLAGLEGGRNYGFAGYGPLSMLLMTCANGLDAIRTGIRYQRLTYLYSTLDFMVDAPCSALVLIPPALPRRAFRFRIDSEMSGTHKMLRDIQGSIGADLHPTQVDMPYRKPGEAAAYEAHFGCPVRFGEKQARFWIRNEFLQLPFPTHDPAAHALYRRLCDEQLALLGRDMQKLAERVILHLELYPDRLPDAGRIARFFGMPERSFRRRLADEGRSFRDLVAEVRFRRARQLLHEPGLSIEDVAERLGYSEAAAFIHAFQRWSGQSPRAWRQGAADGRGDGGGARR